MLLLWQVQRPVGGVQVLMTAPAISHPLNVDLTEHRGEDTVVSGLDACACDAF